MERKFPPGRLQGAPGLPLLNLEKLSFPAAMAFRGCAVFKHVRYGARTSREERFIVRLVVLHR